MGFGHPLGKYGEIWENMVTCQDVLCCGAPTRCIKHESCVCAVAARIVIQYVAVANHVIASSRLIMPPAAWHGILIGHKHVGSRHARRARDGRERTAVGRACATCARRKEMSVAGPGPLSIGIIWGIDCLAKYWKNTWQIFRQPNGFTGEVRLGFRCFRQSAVRIAWHSLYYVPRECYGVWLRVRG